MPTRKVSVKRKPRAVKFYPNKAGMKPAKAYKPRPSKYRPRKFRARRYGSKSGLTSFDKKVEAVVYDKMCARASYIYQDAQQAISSNTAPTANAVLFALPMLMSPYDLYQFAINIYSGEPRSVTRIRIEDSYIKSTIVNQTLSNCQITLYYCIARRDVPAIENTVTNIFSNGLSDPFSSGSNPSATDYSVTPFMSPRFCAFFKIYKVKKHILAGGAALNVQVSTKRPFLFNPTVDYNAGSSVNIIAHRLRSKFIFCKMTGQPTNDSVTTTQVGFTKAKVNINSTTCINYTWLSNPLRQTTLGSNVGFGTVTLPNIIAPMGEIKTTDATA